jgi:hypothetical protein
VLVSFIITVTKYFSKPTEREERKYLVLLLVLEVLVHHGREGITEGNSSHHCSQGERKRERENA